jgi:hypothetical protein
MTSNSPDDDKALTEEQRREEAIERGRLLAARTDPEAFAPPARTGAKMVRLGLYAIGAVAVAGAGYLALRSDGLSDVEVRERIVKESIAAYQAEGRPCACPFNVMANGQECGDFSAYNKPGAATPACYPKDVSDAMVREWRRRN